MNMQDVITLRSISIEVDAYGVPQQSVSENDVYARVESVSASEFFDAGQNGIKPEYRFTVSAWDYHDEEELVFHDRLYSIYRMYRRSLDLIELYAERKAGVHGSEQTDTGASV